MVLRKRFARVCDKHARLRLELFSVSVDMFVFVSYVLTRFFVLHVVAIIQMFICIYTVVACACLMLIYVILSLYISRKLSEICMHSVITTL